MRKPFSETKKHVEPRSNITKIRLNLTIRSGLEHCQNQPGN